MCIEIKINNSWAEVKVSGYDRYDTQYTYSNVSKSAIEKIIGKKKVPDMKEVKAILDKDLPKKDSNDCCVSCVVDEWWAD